MENVSRDQVLLCTQFLFGRTIATALQPHPSIDWAGGDVMQIRAQWRALNLNIPELLPEDFRPSLANLVEVVKHFYNHQPNLTRRILTDIDAWLVHADQLVKSGLIDAAYPNAEGGAAVNDAYVSFTSFLGEIVEGGTHLLKRYLNGS